MSSIRTLVALSTQYLAKKGVARARRQAEELLGAVLNRKWLDLYLDYDEPIEKRECTLYREWIKRRGKGEPIEYITQKLEFMSCVLIVTPEVLIPRRETEVLVSLVLKEIDGGVVWDLCTGSGCIGLAIKKNCPAATLTLSDLSPEALAIARRNAQYNALEVRLLEGDLLAPFFGEKADVIICNPPYVSQEDYMDLEREVRDFEPERALVAQRGGYEFFERLSTDLPHFLHRGGKVFFEIGANQRERVEDLFHQQCWTRKVCKKDWAGLDRFFFLEFYT